MSMSPDLISALGRLEAALTEFSDAYGRWLQGGGDDAALKDLLQEAEVRLDEAREALSRIQAALQA